MSDQGIRFFETRLGRSQEISTFFSLLLPMDSRYFIQLAPGQVSYSARLVCSGSRFLLNTHWYPDIFPEKE